VTNDLLDDLLASINEQLQSHGLMIKGATGAVIDATLIAHRPCQPERNDTFPSSYR
jgi:hypothetical protein